MTEETLTPQEEKVLNDFINQNQIAPNAEEKYNVHTFLHKVATSDDTTKTGYLKDEEVGKPKYPVRALKQLALIANTIVGNEYMANYFLQQSENITASSLSRDGFLVKQGTTQTKQVADITKPKTENKSWFKKKDNSSPPSSGVP